MWSKEDCYYVSIAERSFARLLQVNPANIEIKLTLTLSLLQRKLIQVKFLFFTDHSAAKIDSRLVKTFG